jgi:hypothetical protein
MHESFAGMHRIERNIGTPGLQHAEQADHHIEGTFQK